MQEFFQTLALWLTPIFVVTTMLNVGLTQKPANILRHLRNWKYLVRMVVVNFTVVPGVMLLSVELFGIEAPYAIGLIIFSTAAGAPLLIKLTARSENDIAAGATVQMALMLTTVVVMPLILPRLLEGVSVDSGQITSTLLVQMILPLVLGMLILTFAEKFTAIVQPWIARISNTALYAMLFSVLVGNLDQLLSWQMWGALATGIFALIIGFFVGHMTGLGNETQSEIGALGTAQRNTAAGMIVAQTSFTDPTVFLTVALLNTLMMFILLFLAHQMSKDIEFSLFVPLMADKPQD